MYSTKDIHMSSTYISLLQHLSFQASAPSIPIPKSGYQGQRTPLLFSPKQPPNLPRDGAEHVVEIMMKELTARFVGSICL